eukprot:PhM_4_TR17746/c0_g1_i1/m.3634
MTSTVNNAIEKEIDDLQHYSERLVDDIYQTKLLQEKALRDLEATRQEIAHVIAYRERLREYRVSSDNVHAHHQQGRPQFRCSDSSSQPSNTNIPSLKLEKVHEQYIQQYQKQNDSPAAASPATGTFMLTPGTLRSAPDSVEYQLLSSGRETAEALRQRHEEWKRALSEQMSAFRSQLKQPEEKGDNGVDSQHNDQIKRAPCVEGFSAPAGSRNPSEVPGRLSRNATPRIVAQQSTTPRVHDTNDREVFSRQESSDLVSVEVLNKTTTPPTAQHQQPQQQRGHHDTSQMGDIASSAGFETLAEADGAGVNETNNNKSANLSRENSGSKSRSRSPPLSRAMSQSDAGWQTVANQSTNNLSNFKGSRGNLLGGSGVPSESGSWATVTPTSRVPPQQIIRRSPAPPSPNGSMANSTSTWNTAAQFE